MMARSRTAAVIALKPAEHAKSRLGVPDPLRRRLAWTMALDTLSALSRVMSRVLVVSDQPALEARLRRAGLAVEVIGESGHVGMNPALSHGDRTLRAQGFATVMACVGDLPALTTGLCAAGPRRIPTPSAIFRRGRIRRRHHDAGGARRRTCAALSRPVGRSSSRVRRRQPVRR